ncbi:MAG TPA: deoxyribodipyrimidine photolyase, partial [Bdellovibrionales bacterium]|nr:deoxyribodipyrimidine photolyase [Bdellovibrionales bacterium]
MILFHFPHSENEVFKSTYSKIPWREDQEDFRRWCEGKTGYPLVDAGMRELVQTGYMHNRVRMLVASFLCKHLLISWKWGERFFAKHLLDFELASNVGNWQWAAGTGVDAAPYFRIFNPSTQFKKFDPDEEYVTQWVPEWKSEKYVEPMVDHEFARRRALKAYKENMESKK